MEEVISIKEACERLGTNPQTLYRWRQSGLVKIIPAKKAGVRLSEIERILNQRKEASKNESKESASIQRGN